MSIHEYFERATKEWNIQDFLDECIMEPLGLKLDCYTKSLENIANHEGGDRKKRAQLLLDKYKMGTRPDRQIAKSWDDGRSQSQVYIHQPTITGDNINGFVNMNRNGTFVSGGSVISKRDQQEDYHEELQKKQARIDDVPIPPRVVTPPHPPRTPEHQIFSSSSFVSPTTSESEETDSDEFDADYQDPNDYTFDEFVHVDGDDADDDEEEEAETTNNKKAKENKNGPFMLREKHRLMIEKEYNNMKKERMWKLSTGKYVEKELFELGKKLKFEHAIHSFILDVSDDIIKQHFSKEECDEIDSASGPQVSDISDEINEFLLGFLDKSTLKDIRKIIKETMFDDSYDREKDHDKDYIVYAIYSLLREIENRSLKVANLEAWFNCHVWSPIFDQAFGDMDVISIVRGESASLASGTRKNAKRPSGKRRKMGRRGDWILRVVGNGDRDEFGAGEAGKSWVDEHGTKFLSEAGLKLPKTLKDMLVKLMTKTGWDEERCSKIQTVGVIHAGLMIMMVYLDNPKGYICRIRRSELMEVPDNAEEFPDILDILASVLNVKAVVQETMKAVYTKNKKQMTKSFKGARFRKRPLNEIQIPPCLKTPKKAKVCPEANAQNSYPSSPCPGH